MPDPMLPATTVLPWWSWRRWLRVGAPDGAREIRPDQVSYGADYARGSVSAPAYDVETAMSAYAAFPWVYAALLRASGDLAGLPLRVVQGRGKSAHVLDDHPLYDLLARPFVGWTGRQLRRQLYVDVRLTGNAVCAYVGVGRAVSVLRLHPTRTTIEPDSKLGAGHYIHDSTRRYAAEDIAHVRLPSWEDDPRGLWGAGAIQALHDDLTTDRRAARSASLLAKRARPDMIVSPSDSKVQWTDEFRKALKTKLDLLLSGGGTVVISGGAKIDLPSWRPRDIEFPALRQLVREAVLAVTGVPPHMVGLPTANYAQAREQTLVYWEMLRAYAADFEDALWNPLARRFGNDLSISHDLSGVDILQEARTARLARVQQWWLLGMEASAAAAYEGFSDAPLPSRSSTTAPKDDPDRGALSDRALRSAALYLVAPTARRRPTTEPEREAAWRGFIADVHQPAERALQRALALALRQQRDRVSAALERARPEHEAMLDDWRAVEGDQVDATRDIVADLVDAVWDKLGEDQAMSEAAAKPIRAALTRAFKRGAEAIGKDDLKWTPSRIDRAVDGAIGELVVNVNATTHDAVRELIRAGLDDGASIAEMQSRLMLEAAFGPARALNIARTETTRAVTAGQQTAWRQAVAETEGLAVRQEWLSARDDVVRDAHVALDGQVVALDDPFRVPSGDFAGSEGAGPGQFAEAALVCNCRCTVLPVLLKEA